MVNPKTHLVVEELTFAVHYKQRIHTLSMRACVFTVLKLFNFKYLKKFLMKKLMILKRFGFLSFEVGTVHSVTIWNWVDVDANTSRNLLDKNSVKQQKDDACLKPLKNDYVKLIKENSIASVM